MSVQDLDKLIGKRDYRQFLNSKNEIYREMGMKENPPPRDQALQLMSEHPNLIKRPLVVQGGAIVFGFDEEALTRIAG
jgi:arsenate reductase-like glutaredoxin family protein